MRDFARMDMRADSRVCVCVCLHDMHIESILPYPIPHRFIHFRHLHHNIVSINGIAAYALVAVTAVIVVGVDSNKNAAQREPIVCRSPRVCAYDFDGCSYSVTMRMDF